MITVTLIHTLTAYIITIENSSNQIYSNRTYTNRPIVYRYTHKTLYSNRTYTFQSNATYLYERSNTIIIIHFTPECICCLSCPVTSNMWECVQWTVSTYSCVGRRCGYLLWLWVHRSLCGYVTCGCNPSTYSCVGWRCGYTPILL